MIAYADEIDLVRRALDLGVHRLEIAAPFPSVISRFLDDVVGSDLADELTVMRLTGVAELSDVPFAALASAGFELPETRGSALVADLIRRLSSAESARRLVLVDREAEVDDVSLGVLKAAAATGRGIRLVTTTNGPARERQGQSGHPATTRIAVGQVRYAVIERLLADALGDAVDERTLSLIFSLSGGYPDVAEAVARAAVLSGALVSEAGHWVLTGPLWSKALVPLMQSMLDGISRDELDAVATISITNMLDRTALSQTMASVEVEELEARGLVEERTVHGRPALVVVPPILAEYFRHELQPQLRRRLLELVTDAQASTAPDTEVWPAATGGVDALSVRLAHEVGRARQHDAQERFSRTPDAVNAAALLDTLLSSGLVEREQTDRAIAAIRRELPLDTVPSAVLAGLALATAYVDDDRTAALRLLTRHGSTRPRTERGPLIVAEADIRLRDGIIDADLLELLDSDTADTDEVRTHLLELRAYVLAAHADFEGALGCLNQLDDLPEAGRSSRYAIAFSMTMCGQGHPIEAEAHAAERFADARDTYDMVALWRTAYALGVARIYQGRFEETVPLLNSMLALGSPPPPCEPEAAALVSAAEVVGLRVGSPVPDSVRALGAELRSRAGGVLPGMSGEWVRARTADNLSTRAVSDETWRNTSKIWQRGARLSALITMTTAIERDPTPERLTEFTKLLRSSPSPFSDACGALATMMSTSRPSDAVEAAEQLGRAGRFGLAYDAYTRAMQWAHDAGDTATETRAETSRSALSAMSRANYGAMRRRVRTQTLTSREQEIATLLTTGTSNVDIALRLHISVRTVETHVYGIMRKLGVDRREDLAAQDLLS